MSAYHTFQIAIKEDNEWMREYVCAQDKVSAVYQFLEDFPMMTLEFILQADEFEVEACE